MSMLSLLFETLGILPLRQDFRADSPGIDVWAAVCSAARHSYGLLAISSWEQRLTEDWTDFVMVAKPNPSQDSKIPRLSCSLTPCMSKYFHSKAEAKRLDRRGRCGASAQCTAISMSLAK